MDAPFLRLPSASPKSALVDTTHSFHIHGVGVDFAASFVVLAAEKGMWGGGRGIDKKLELAYRDFVEYCAIHGKTTRCGMWSRLKFDMPRVNSFPSSVDGKGFDTVLVCQWLEAFLSNKVGMTKL